jgi:hypothetical protein
MIHTGREIARGTEVEIRRGDHVIIARVVWRDGGRAGLRSEDRVPVEEIMTLGRSPGFQLTAATGERRKQPRLEERKVLLERAMELAIAALIGIGLAAAGLSMVQGAFAGPLARVFAAPAR